MLRSRAWDDPVWPVCFNGVKCDRAYISSFFTSTTLESNTFPMGVAGSFTGWVIYKLSLKVGIRQNAAVFLAAFAADLTTYAVTAGQLAVAFPAAHRARILGQLVEGIVSVVVYKFSDSFCSARVYQHQA